MKVLKKKVFLLPDVFIDFEREHIYSANNKKLNIGLTNHEMKIIRFLCMQSDNGNDGYVTNKELFELIYGTPCGYDYTTPDIKNITRAMSKLRGKKSYDYKLCVSNIIISNNRGSFKICLNESPFEDNESTSNKTNPIAEYIDQYHLPRFNISTLRYDAENTSFCGRTDEMKLLFDFVNDSKPLLWWVITGKGGSGKSRLAYELMKSLNHRHDISLEGNWKATMIEWSGFYLHTKNHLDDLVEWTSKKNYLIIIDYVQSFEREIADFIQRLTRLVWSESKVRVLLLERAPKIQDQHETRYEPLWFRTFKSGWENIDWLYGTCYKRDFIHLLGVDVSSAIDIVKSYADANNRVISDSECNDLINYVKKISNHGIIPLLLLCVTETWLDSPALYNKPEHISSSTIWSQIIEKEKREITHNCSDIISNALLEIHTIACIIHRLELNSVTIDKIFSLNRFYRYLFYKNEIISNLFESKYNIRSNFTDYLAAIEPDIIGEYFVYTILQDYSEDEYKELFIFLYENYKKETDRFFWRYFSDFNTIVSKHPGYQFFATMIFDSIRHEIKDQLEHSVVDEDNTNEKAIFNVTNSDGIKIECEMLFTFDSEETGKSYMVYTDNTKDENGNTKVYASVYIAGKETTELLPIETEAEWKMISILLSSLQEEIQSDNQ